MRLCFFSLDTPKGQASMRVVALTLLLPLAWASCPNTFSLSHAGGWTWKLQHDDSVNNVNVDGTSVASITNPLTFTYPQDMSITSTGLDAKRTGDIVYQGFEVRVMHGNDNIVCQIYPLGIKATRFWGSKGEYALTDEVSKTYHVHRYQFWDDGNDNDLVNDLDKFDMTPSRGRWGVSNAYLSNSQYFDVQHGFVFYTFLENTGSYAPPTFTCDDDNFQPSSKQDEMHYTYARAGRLAYLVNVDEHFQQPMPFGIVSCYEDSFIVSVHVMIGIMSLASWSLYCLRWIRAS